VEFIGIPFKRDIKSMRAKLTQQESQRLALSTKKQRPKSVNFDKIILLAIRSKGNYIALDKQL